MAEALPTPRVALLREIVARPFAKTVVALLALLGTLATIRELVLPEPAQAKLKFYRLWTLSWPWWLWALVVLISAVFVLFEGAVAAVRKRETTVLELRNSLQARPFITVEYSANATEEEPDIFDTLVFRNIGAEPALAVSIETDPKSFAQATPRLGWPINLLLPAETKETIIFSLDGMLSHIQQAIVDKRGKCPDLRIPLRVRYGDTKGRTWITEYAAVYHLVAPRIEDITGVDPTWTDLSDLGEHKTPTSRVWTTA